MKHHSGHPTISNWDARIQSSVVHFIVVALTANALAVANGPPTVWETSVN